MLRQGSGEPLILLHGVAGGPLHWREVMPLLAPHHDTMALSAIGHAGGARPSRRPVTIIDVIDDIERQLDALGLADACSPALRPLASTASSIRSRSGALSVEGARRAASSQDSH